MITQLQKLWQQRKTERRVRGVINQTRLAAATRKVFVVGRRSQAEEMCPWATCFVEAAGGWWCLSYRKPEPFVYCEGRR